uniref:COMM domain-containing protein 1 n=2 Tax=Phaeomonas parva TaxID=124430 RepID=A0A7S1XV71_9STRA|mmetsp:Transcript_35980/g.113060  ORF Transcript_35980/g.113060 Transcript_35980/m.113060 type:complete len:183 (+) Transcript_35980:150-698(+)|eukprot:CAMPEP_0118864570 /NCGR_PEP_ID=MMETSP1163-20130328/9110_1 /TAXON_ID=124430 /ORGANISM="Phaeomonas parva, Strain CCMP2877" /LENGTH=182 /DNA_ID=CAMNT_0006798715 /DNA_START=113 /DNA_END=661 /DNA_ORIENTATION=-
MSLACGLPERHFLGLLNGLKRQIFEGDAECSNEFLKQSLFEGDAEAADEVLATAARLLTRAAKENWDLGTLETHLSALDIAPAHAQVFGRFWRKEAAKIHQILYESVRWSGALDSFRWRVDMQAASAGDMQGVSEPSAICEFTVRRGVGGATPGTVRLELSRDQMTELFSVVDAIDEKMAQT